MVSLNGKRLDLGAWLADLRRIGGQARTLAEGHGAIDNLIDLADLKMLEEATKRLIVALGNTGANLYGLGSSIREDGGSHRRTRSVAATALEPALLLPDQIQPSPVYAGTNPQDAIQQTVRSHPHSHGIIGNTESMRRVHHLIDKAAACSLPVLIQGESGTGKELVARAIHEHSPRSGGRFFSENCSALSESLLESELFGHVRGAFTGADRDRKGILELADGGTLFLDEIGDMSVRMQSKLLRALQEREFRPVGGKQTIRVDVRVISATNRSLRSLIRENQFREDLFYRINVITLTLPALRERRDDIPNLVEHFLSRIASETGIPRKQITPGALQLLSGHDWPGNIRELENVVQRAMALSDGMEIQADDLPDRIRHLMITEESPHYSSAGKGGEQLMIEKALHNFEGDKTRASRFIGWSRPKLYRRMRFYGIPIQFGRSRSERL